LSTGLYSKLALLQIIDNLIFSTTGKQILEITDPIQRFISDSKVSDGLLNISILHTSCSLMIQENADSTVLADIKNFLNKVAPEKKEYFHNTEGPDDMPAHLKTMLTQTNLTLSVKRKRIVLGTWQGIFLLEHRSSNKKREILIHLLGN